MYVPRVTDDLVDFRRSSCGQSHRHLYKATVRAIRAVSQSTWTNKILSIIILRINTVPRQAKPSPDLVMESIVVSKTLRRCLVHHCNTSIHHGTFMCTIWLVVQIRKVAMTSIYITKKKRNEKKTNN